METLQQLAAFIATHDVTNIDTPVGIIITTSGKFMVLMSLGSPSKTSYNVTGCVNWIAHWLVTFTDPLILDKLENDASF